MCIFFVKCTCCHCRGWVGCASSKENREKNGFYGQADHRGAQPDQKHLGKFWSNFPLLSVMSRPLRVVVFDFESSSSRVVVKSSSIESSIE